MGPKDKLYPEERDAREMQGNRRVEIVGYRQVIILLTLNKEINEKDTCSYTDIQLTGCFSQQVRIPVFRDGKFGFADATGK